MAPGDDGAARAALCLPGRLPRRGGCFVTPAVQNAGPRLEANVAQEASAPLDGWLETHSATALMVVLGIGFLLRLRAAAHGYFSPDEAVIYIVAHQASLAATYKLSLLEAHPPLWYFLLHFWHLLGHSEVILRLPSVLAGTAAPWVFYKWLKIVFGARTAWIGLLLLTFSSAMIAQSIEARQYPLLLLFFAAALYFLERALGEDSLPKMALFALFLFLALATHYSALWFAIAAGVYALGRIRRSPPSRAVTQAWLGAMVGAAALFGFFYATHIARLRSSGLISWMENTGWISELYFHPAQTGALTFMLSRSVWFFQYLFGQEVVGFAMFALFLIAASLLLDPRVPLPGKATPRLLALFVFLPFLMACAAALAGLYPYGGIREDLYLAPFAAAGLGSGLGQLGGRRRAWPGLGLAGLAVLWGLWTVPAGIRLSPYLGKTMIAVPLEYIRQAIPQNQSVLTDYSTILTLGYYLCDDQGFPFDSLQRGLVEYRCGGQRFLVSSRHTFTPANFPDAVERAARTGGLDAGEWLWVAHAGWGDHLTEKLARNFPELRPLPRQEYNEGIAIFQVVVPRREGAGQ
jgi:Dolichyl-phosphate-mannose-protein mannosyltransferase